MIWQYSVPSLSRWRVIRLPPVSCAAATRTTAAFVQVKSEAAGGLANILAMVASFQGAPASLVICEPKFWAESWRMSFQSSQRDSRDGSL